MITLKLIMYFMGLTMLCTAAEYMYIHRLWTIFWDEPFLSRLDEINMSIKDVYRKFFISVHKNRFAPQTLGLLEKLALIFTNNCHRDHTLLTLTRKDMTVNCHIKDPTSLKWWKLKLILLHQQMFILVIYKRKGMPRLMTKWRKS